MVQNIIDNSSFKTSIKNQFFVKHLLEQIENLSPDDSYMEAYLEKDSDIYKTSIEIKHAFGHFEAKTMGTDLKKTVSQASDKILRQIQTWKKHRFDDEQH
ncbi:MAG: hypothetical protein IPM57_09905 [Oligoflexia bacterium]|nr:hypothetical protein [Oligoflexia bacterium]